MANELKYHMNMLNSIDRKVGGPGNWTYIIDALNSIDQGLTSYIPDQKQEIEDFVEQVIASIPSDYTALEQATYNAYPVQSENGNQIYFDDGAKDIPVKELIVNLEPKQEGGGDPSPTNVRPINGYDGIDIFRTGKNLFSSNKTSYTYNGITYTFNSDGSVTFSGTATANSDIVLFGDDTLKLTTGSYIFSGASGGSSNTYGLAIRIRNNSTSTNRYVFCYSGETAFEMADGEVINRVYINIKSGVTVSMTVYPMIRVASASSSYSAPRSKSTYPFSFSETVYGGTLNPLTGVLTVDKYNLLIDPTKIPDNYIHFDVLDDVIRVGNLLLDTHFGLSSAYRAKYDSPSTFRNGAVSNWSFERNKGYSSNTVGFYFSSDRAFYLFCDKSIFSTQDAEGFKRYLTNNPLYICYTLKTPITYQLTPAEITTLFMGNTIWVDGETTQINLTYRQDTDTVIDRLTNAIISLGGNV